MSWVENIQTKLIIITGDKKEFIPEWMEARKDVTFNTTEFEFPNIRGTLVRRKQAKGNKYDILIHFQGDDHLDVSAEFEESSKDPRAWIIRHPYYNDLIVQPLGLRFDNIKHNVTTITGTVLETISEDFPESSLNVQEQIAQLKTVADTTTSISYVNNNSTVTTDDINSMNEVNDNFETTFAPIIISDEDNEAFDNLISISRTAINNAISAPLEAITAMQDVVNFIADLDQSVDPKILVIKIEFDRYTSSFDGIASDVISFGDKLLYEVIGGVLITGLSSASSSFIQDEDYETRNEVSDVVSDVLTSYDSFLLLTDFMQADFPIDPESYIPNVTGMTDVDRVVNTATANLFNIAFEAKQEREILVEKDSNIINLSHRFYGLLTDDSTIDTLIKNNNIGISEILVIKKNRRILFYV